MVVVIGAGGHAHELASYLTACGEQPVGFLDDRVEPGEYYFGTVIGTVAAAADVADRFALGIGAPEIRRQVDTRLRSMGLSPISIVHPTSVLGERSTFADGAVVGPNTSLTCDVNLGTQTHLHAGVVCAHDVTLGDYVTVTPGVSIAGNVIVGDCVWLGIGASVLQGINIGEGATIGAGAVVTRNVPAGATVVGVPAKELHQ